MTESKQGVTHEPTTKTRSEVAALRSYGIPQEEVAAYIGVDPKTLRKYYREELDKAAITANAKVGQFLYQNASGQTLVSGATHSDCVRAAMFWAKTRMGWRESQDINHTSSDGSMTPAPALDMSKLSTEALAEIVAAADAAKPK